MEKDFYGTMKVNIMIGEEATIRKEDFEGGGATALEPKSENLPAPEFVKVEKNLASLGFFTPSSKRTRNTKAKTVVVTIIIDGKRVEAKATIAPTALFGLPITADQDKWLALHKIVTDIQARDGIVKNPVSFTSAELLALLKIYKDSGKNYKDVTDWLDVMVGTTIISEGAVYASGQRVFGKDRFHVFDRAVSFGKELPDGSIADKNYVWLSEWQLKNINDHHQLPIDLDSYCQLKNYIAKALVLQLQVWLYASREEGVFEKRYDEICQILSIRQWPYASKIKEKLGPSLNELKKLGYLTDWQLEKTRDGQNYKIVFYHGEKFHRDRRARLAQKQQVGLLPSGQPSSVTVEKQHRTYQRRLNLGRPPQEQPAASPVNADHLAALTSRGVTQDQAREHLATLPADFPLIDTLEYGDAQIKKNPDAWRNPAGYYVYLVRDRVPPPPTWETRAQREAKLTEKRQQDEERQAAEAKKEQAYQESEAALDNLQATDPARWQTLYDKAKAEVFVMPLMKGREGSTLHEGAIRAHMKKLLHQRPPISPSEEGSAQG